MSRLVPGAIIIIGLCTSPAVAAPAPAPLLEPIAVAVAPPGDGIARADAAPAAPSAESRATSSTRAAAPPEDQSKAKQADRPKLDDGKRGLALEVTPFGWQIGLISR
jgi:hypothetical protein